MGHLDNAPVTDRPTAEPGAPRPAPTVVPPEPPSRGPVVLVALASAAAITAAVVVLTSGGEDPSPTPTAARTPVVTATATLDPALPAPASPTAGDAATTGAPDPGTAPAPAAGSAPAAPAAPAAPGAALPAGWETRTFQGVTFAVPAGATQPDLTDPGNADAPALFNWTGPSLGGDVFAHVSLWIHPAGSAPTLGPEYPAITVPGAGQARMWTGPTGAEPATTTVDVHVLAGDRFINLVGTFAAGAAGEQTVEDLVASLSIG